MAAPYVLWETATGYSSPEFHLNTGLSISLPVLLPFEHICRLLCRSLKLLVCNLELAPPRQSDLPLVPSVFWPLQLTVILRE